MATERRDSVLAKLRMLEAGLQKHPPKGPIMLASQSYSSAQLIARIEKSIAVEQNVQTAKVQLNEALLKSQAVRATEKEFLQGLRTIITSQYTTYESILADFGIAPPKRPKPRSVITRATMSAKNRATRQKRGTLGPKQKKAIKGDVTGVTITPVHAGKKKDEDE